MLGNFVCYCHLPIVFPNDLLVIPSECTPAVSPRSIFFFLVYSPLCTPAKKKPQLFIVSPSKHGRHIGIMTLASSSAVSVVWFLERSTFAKG